VSQYLSKGRRVYVEGRLKTRSWEKEGVTRYMTEIIAQNMIMLDGGGEGGAPRQTDRSYDSGSSDYGSDFSSDVDEDVPF
jgi:single-strand DNA-binding protein